MILRNGEYPGDPSKSAAKLSALQQVLKLLTPKSMWFQMTPLSTESFNKAILSASRLHPVTISCKHIHDNHCLIEVLLGATRWTSKVWHIYLLAHLVPHLIFKKDKFSLQALKQLAKNIVQNLVFFWLYCLAAKLMYCYSKEIPGGLGSYSAIVMSILCPVTIFAENKRRWSLFSMAILPKWFEGLHIYLSKMRLWPTVPLGEKLLFAWTIGTLALGYYTESASLNRQIMACIKFILGKSEDEDNNNNSQFPTTKDSSDNNTIPAHS